MSNNIKFIDLPLQYNKIKKDVIKSFNIIHKNADYINGYEVLKLTAKYNDFILFKLLSKPGLLLLYITTKIPSDDQVEVALESLKFAFNYDVSKYEGKEHVAEAIG